MLEINLQSKNLTPEELRFAHKATQLILSVLKTKLFKDELLSLNCSQVFMPLLDAYNLIMSGYSNYDKKNDSDIDLDITLFNGDENGKVIGYTLMKSARIFTNRAKFYNYMKSDNVVRLAMHWFHEYLHSCGWYHRSRIGWRIYNIRKTFVYKAADAFEKVAYLINAGGQLELIDD